MYFHARRILLASIRLKDAQDHNRLYSKELQKHISSQMLPSDAKAISHDSHAFSHSVVRLVDESSFRAAGS